MGDVPTRNAATVVLQHLEYSAQATKALHESLADAIRSWPQSGSSETSQTKALQSWIEAGRNDDKMPPYLRGILSLLKNWLKEPPSAT